MSLGGIRDQPNMVVHHSHTLYHLRRQVRICRRRSLHMIGMQLVEATTLAALGMDEIAGKLIPTMPLLVAQVYNRRLASAVKLADAVKPER